MNQFALMPWYVLLEIAFLLFVSGLAMWQGRAPEKIVGLGLAVNEGLYLLLYHPADAINAQYEAMVIDAIYAAVIGFVAIRYNRTWAKWAAAFEMLIVGAHVATAIDLRIATAFEVWISAIWTNAVVWAVFIGTIQVILEDRRLRRERDVAASAP